MKTKITPAVFHLDLLPGPFCSGRVRSLILAFGLSALIGSIAFADRATIDPTKTQIALPLSTPPTIDGVIDPDEWNRAGGFANDFWRVGANPDLADGVLGGVVSGGTAPADNDDLSFRIYVGYDTNNLYVAVRVRDSVLQEDTATADSRNENTWMDDSVEVFIDADNSNAVRWNASQPGGQYVITINNAYREMEAGDPGYGPAAAWFAKTSTSFDGYDAEFRIALTNLNNPKTGDIIGFTVAVNDDDDGGDNDRQIAWVGAAHEPVTYGNLMLDGHSYTAPKTTALVVDGTINPSEYTGATEIKVDIFNGIYDITSGDNDWPVTDHGFSAWVVHDADAIYVAVNVTDDIIVTDTAAAGSEDGATWEDDSVEIFFDPNNSKDSGRGSLPFEGQYVLTANGAWRDNEANNPKFGATDDWFAATTSTAGGYAIEFKVKKSALLNLQDGVPMGFHIAINDDDGALPAPKTQLGWSGFAHAEFTYGTLILGGATTPGNVLPTVAITAPTNAATFTAPTNITITASASDTDGSVSKVEFFAGTNLIGTATTSPYSITWSNVTAGAYALTAKATDNQGGSKVSAAVSITVSSGAAPGAFQLFEDFQQTTAGDLNGQRGWTATLAEVTTDPANATNQVASFEGAADGGAHRPLLIPQGATATLFYRFRSEVEDPNLRDFWAGVSDVAVSGIGAFGDFEAQIGLTGNAAPLRVRDGAIANNVDVDEHLPSTWYKIWAVIDNATDRYEVYVQGGSRTEQTQVDIDSNGATSFVFRNSGAGPAPNDLIRFLVKSGSGARPGPVLLDDIYLATGKILTDPTRAGGVQLRIIEIKPELTSGNITLRWEGEGPQFQVERAATITGTFQPIGSMQTAREFTDPGVLKTSASSFYRVR